MPEAGSDEEEGDTLGGEPPVEGESFAAAADDVQPTEDGSVFMAGDDAEAADDGSFLPVADEHEPAAEDETFADEPDESAEVEAPPIMPVDLDQGRLPIEIDEQSRVYSVAPLEAIRSFAGRPPLPRVRH